MDATGNPTAGSESFYASIAVFRGFGSLMDPALYSPLPDDWSIGVADIVEFHQGDRRAALQGGQHGRRGGDRRGHQCARAAAIFPSCSAAMAPASRCRPTISIAAREALAATATWVEDDLDLVMRVALVPVAAVRAQGLDVRVARFGPSPNLSYAMFSGGGLGWAEAAMKRGEFAVPPAPPGTPAGSDRPVLPVRGNSARRAG